MALPFVLCNSCKWISLSHGPCLSKYLLWFWPRSKFHHQKQNCAVAEAAWLELSACHSGEFPKVQINCAFCMHMHTQTTDLLLFESGPFAGRSDSEKRTVVFSLPRCEKTLLQFLINVTWTQRSLDLKTQTTQPPLTKQNACFVRSPIL